MVFIWMHPAAKIPHITKTIQQLTGTSGNGVSLYADSDNNTSYKQDNAASQEHHEVFICLHTAITIPHITKTIQQFTGTDYGVYLDAYSKLQQTKKEKNTQKSSK